MKAKVVEQQERQEIQCSRCLYRWKTRSRMWKVSCPSCGNKCWVKERASMLPQETHEKASKLLQNAQKVVYG